MEEIRCKSTFCIVTPDSIRGRMFTPPEGGDPLTQVWCQHCIKIGKQLAFFSSRTAQMIRDTYKTYNDTNLPKEVKLILEQFSRELITNLGEEL